MMIHVLFWIVVILAIMYIMIAILSMYRYRGTEYYWPYSVYPDGHYWQGRQTFNNSNRYFDFRPYLGIYRNLQLGAWKESAKMQPPAAK